MVKRASSIVSAELRRNKGQLCSLQQIDQYLTVRFCGCQTIDAKQYLDGIVEQINKPNNELWRSFHRQGVVDRKYVGPVDKNVSVMSVYKEISTEETTVLQQSRTIEPQRSRSCLRYLATLSCYGKPKLFHGAVEVVKQSILDCCKDNGWKLLIGNVQIDHVHVVVEAQSSTTPDKIIHSLRYRSSEALYEQCGWLFRGKNKASVWDQDFHIETAAITGESYEKVIRYVRGQWKRHKPEKISTTPTTSEKSKRIFQHNAI